MSNVLGSDYLIEITYLIATALFILSLKWLSHPRTARQGVRAGEIGMVLAIVGTMLIYHVVTWKWIIIGMVIGSLIGRGAGLREAGRTRFAVAAPHVDGGLRPPPHGG